MIDMSDMDIHHGTLTLADWRRIHFCLEYYIRERTDELKRQNVGDGPWDALSRFKSLSNDVDYFILSGKGSQPESYND